MRFHRSLFVATALAATCAAAGAQTLKPGLWEINNKMNSPQMDSAMAEMQKQLASMPPDQRKQMEAMMAQRGMSMPGAAAGGGTVIKICMTKEQVERNEVPMQKNDCTMSQQQKSGGTVKFAFSCPNPPSNGEGEFTMASSEAYSSKMKVTTTVQGKPETMTMEGAGKWLGTDCGNIKPMVPPKK
jgi:hypothetical protein